MGAPAGMDEATVTVGSFLLTGGLWYESQPHPAAMDIIAAAATAHKCLLRDARLPPLSDEMPFNTRRISAKSWGRSWAPWL